MLLFFKIITRAFIYRIIKKLSIIFLYDNLKFCRINVSLPKFQASTNKYIFHFVVHPFIAMDSADDTCVAGYTKNIILACNKLIAVIAPFLLS